MSIGEFSARTRLSPKALRLYGELGLVVPASVDPETGYRRYSEDQIASARLVAALRRLDMPLAAISGVIELQGPAAARAVGAWWAQEEARTARRRDLVAYLHDRLSGEDDPAMYDIQQRTLPARTIVSISRHLIASETDAFFHDAFARLRALAPGLTGIAGVPYLVFYGEVSQDSDGPMELARPVDAEPESLADLAGTDIEIRREAAHEEAFVRLAMREIGWPAMLPVVDALERWTAEHDRAPTATWRQNLIGDRRTATPETPVLDLSVPLR